MYWVLNIFTQIVLPIGRRMENGSIGILGTGFLISKDGLVVTSRHVVADNDNGLFVLEPHIDSLNEYQDTTDNSCRPIGATIVESDPFRDITILKIDVSGSGTLPEIGSFDNVSVGEEVSILGYPHCVEGRRVLTYQTAVIGAKVILDSNGIKSKHAVINTQTRPGQSGSLIFSMSRNMIVGILVGAFAPNSGVSIAGINPKELHQTTHCISAEYIKNMI